MIRPGTLVCASTGQVLNLARLGRDASVSAPTARRWLNLLVTSRLVVLLPPYHRNFGKRIRKSPKLHVIDPGLASWMLGYRTTEAIMNGPARARHPRLPDRPSPSARPRHPRGAVAFLRCGTDAR